MANNNHNRNNGNGKPCRRELMEQINEVSFAVNDVQLFLNTHPNNEDALEYFDEFQRCRNHALREYARYYGPLTIDTLDADETDRWTWIHSPWPWQEGGC